MPFDPEVEREQWALESDKSLLAEIESQALNEIFACQWKQIHI